MFNAITGMFNTQDDADSFKEKLTAFCSDNNEGKVEVLTEGYVKKNEAMSEQTDITTFQIYAVFLKVYGLVDDVKKLILDSGGHSD